MLMNVKEKSKKMQGKERKKYVSHNLKKSKKNQKNAVLPQQLTEEKVKQEVRQSMEH